MGRLMSSVVLALVATAVNATGDRAAFDEWKQMFGRQYASVAEEAQRFEIFQAKLRYYEARNANDTAVYGPDEFADRTTAEFLAVRSCGVSEPLSCLQGSSPRMAPEDVAAILHEKGTAIDWRTKGAVTPVKNQGQYGTCWSFGATGTMEGMNVVQGGNPLESLSEQELIDCSPCGGYVGCCISKYYAPHHYAADTEQSYPYKGRSGSCRRTSATPSKAKAKEVVCEKNGADNNQDNVLAQLQKLGPGAFLVGSSCLDGYRSGIISNCPLRAGSIDHATLLVGAGEENGMPYWIVKNSWGASFGEQGYYRAKRNTNPPQLGAPGGIFGVYDDSVLELAQISV